MVFSGADFTAAKGISALIDEFSIRKQPLYFFNTREDVVTVFQGVLDEDFKYFKTMEALELSLKGWVTNIEIYIDY